MNLKSILIGVGFVTLVLAQKSYGWGQYGHEQINSAAVDLLDKNSSVGMCFQAARETVVRYAITPDVEWKVDLSLPSLNSGDSKKRRDNDCYEHPLHFFEVDAFVDNGDDLKASHDFTKLPSNADYRQAFVTYKALLKQYAATVALVDPTKAIKDKNNPSAAEVMDHGTAPWRARDLYLAGVQALKKKNFKLAMFYLATMGHYIGDMSQPFHATMNFDGDYKPADHHVGIHHEIDTGLFSRMPNTKGEAARDANDVYKTFDPDGSVAKTARTEFGNYKSAMTDADIVPSLLKIIDSGYPEADALLNIYAGECDALNRGSSPAAGQRSRRSVEVGSGRQNATRGNGGHGAVPRAPSDPEVAEKNYCESVTVPGRRPSVKGIGTGGEDQMSKTSLGHDGEVLQTLEVRLGVSAALLAKLWISAYAAAGKPDMGDCGTADWKFDQSYAIQNYLVPDYYPEGFDGRDRKGCSAEANE